MRFPIPILILYLIAFGSNAFAIPLTDASGKNRHNLSSTSNNAVKAQSETRICVFCHTPHGASAESALWNRKDPIGSFSLYSSATLDIDTVSDYGSATEYPNGASRMCLSCHDGVSAIGEFLNNPTVTMTVADLGGRSSQIFLDASHPISFTYSDAVKSAINAAEGVLDDENYRLPGTVPLDSSSRMQCTTCHDPHEDTNNGTDYLLPFWRNYSGTEATDYDTTCGDCHFGSDWGNGWDSGPTLPHTLP
jgi:cytochrome c553